MRLHAGTGSSRARDSTEAGREAALGALAALGDEQPALLIVFTSPRYDLPQLLAAIRSVSGNAPLIGATASGEIVRGDYLGFGAGVGVVAMTSGPYRFGLASASHIAGELDRAGQELARTARAAAGPSAHAAVLLLADSLLGDLQQLVQGVYRITGPKVAIVGGAAGDEQKFVATFVFHDGEVLEQAAVALWIASESPITVVSRHGWEPIGVPLLVTRADGTTLFEIGGRPAALAFEEQLGLAPGQLSAEDFWGTSILHPFGLLQADGSTIIRVARSKSPEGALRIQGCVPPEGSAVQVMSGNADSLLGVVGPVATAAMVANPAAGVLLTFSCAARAAIFKERTCQETQQLQAVAGAIPSFGIYCCGEFARTAGVLGTHNATLTAVAL